MIKALAPLVVLVVVVAWLIDWTKDPMVPAWYQMIGNVAAIIGVILLMPHAEVRRERAAYLAAANASVAQHGGHQRVAPDGRW